MAEGLFYRLPLIEKMLCLVRESHTDESLPDVFYGHRRRVEHVGVVESVVAELVVDNLVGRKIVHTAFAYEAVGGHEQYRLRQLAAVIAVFPVAYRTDSDHDIHVVVYCPEPSDGLAQKAVALVDGQYPLGEEPLRALPAVVNNLARGILDIYVVGAKGDNGRRWDEFALVVTFRTLACKQPVDGVEDAGWIVHYAERIDDGIEMFVAETLADIVGETRPYEEHRLHRTYLELRPWYVYYRSEFHIIDKGSSNLRHCKRKSLSFDILADFLFVSLHPSANKVISKFDYDRKRKTTGRHALRCQSRPGGARRPAPL